MTDKLCPIFSLANELSRYPYDIRNHCRGESCALFNEENNCCSISTIARSLQRIDSGLTNLDGINAALTECRDATQEIGKPLDAHFPRRRNLTKSDRR